MSARRDDVKRLVHEHLNASMIMVPLNDPLEPEMPITEALAYLDEQGFDLTLLRSPEVRIVYCDQLGQILEENRPRKGWPHGSGAKSLDQPLAPHCRNARSGGCDHGWLEVSPRPVMWARPVYPQGTVSSSPASRRAEALALAEDLLSDIELSRIPPTDIARKASRLARLVDDTDAMTWLRFEVGGFERTSPTILTAHAFEAARRSNRVFTNEAGEERANTTTLGEIEATIDASKAQLAAASDKPISLTTQNLPAIDKAIQGNRQERSVLRNLISEKRGVLEKVVGAIHEYVSARYQELRFGFAVESAFEVVRGEVDAHLAELVPDALPKLSAAFENATSNNPEDWASAAATCRRLLKAAADALRPPGAPVDGREMTDTHYINRLVDWIVNQARSETAADMIRSDLEYLGRRLDAADDAGHKGAHADVGRVDASRFVAGTYLLLGDILRLRDDGRTTVGAAGSEAGEVVPVEENGSPIDTRDLRPEPAEEH